MMKQEDESFSKRYAAIFATVVIWSTPSLFQFYLNRYYDPWAQNFYRYSVAFLAVLPFVLYRLRRGGPPLDRSLFLACLVPALPNVIHQITQTVALYHMGPGVYAIFGRSSVIITALLALSFFRRNAGSFGNGNFRWGHCWVWWAPSASSCFKRAGKAGRSDFRAWPSRSLRLFVGRSIVSW